MSFNCEEHKLQSWVLNHCPRCWEIINAKREAVCQQASNSHCEKGVSNSAGTSVFQQKYSSESEKIKAIFEQCTVLRRTLGTVSVGSLSNLMLTESWAGRETIEQQLLESANVSIANLQSILYNLYTRAVIAETDMKLNTEISDASIGMRTTGR